MLEHIGVGLLDWRSGKTPKEAMLKPGNWGQCVEGTAHLQLHGAGWAGLGAQIRTREVSGGVSPAHVMKPGPGPGWVGLGIASGWNQGQECWQQGWGSVSGHPQLPAHRHHHHLPRHLTLPRSPVPSPGENPGWPSACHRAAGGRSDGQTQDWGSWGRTSRRDALSGHARVHSGW